MAKGKGFMKTVNSKVKPILRVAKRHKSVEKWKMRDIKETSKPVKCFLCDRKHWIKECPKMKRFHAMEARIEEGEKKGTYMGFFRSDQCR